MQLNCVFVKSLVPYCSVCDTQEFPLDICIVNGEGRMCIKVESYCPKCSKKKSNGKSSKEITNSIGYTLDWMYREYAHYVDYGNCVDADVIDADVIDADVIVIDDEISGDA